MRRRRALFGNGAFSLIAGSELVILEAAEFLLGLGWQVDIAAWSLGEPMTRLARAAGASVLQLPCAIDAFAYDIVWMQNRIEPLLDFFAEGDDEAARTLFVFAHLDRDWSYAQPGVVVEPTLGQLFLVTSERAVERVVRRGLPRAHVLMTRNAAPDAYEHPGNPDLARLRSLLIVSNHAPEEVVSAKAILRERGVEVVHCGVGGDVRAHRVMPADVARADAVLTIGKTVPYALRARRPVYVYDHFGGPGWLTDRNFVAAQERNFSGLCHARRLDPRALGEEIVDGFAAANLCAASRDVADDYRLEVLFEKILDALAKARTPAEHRIRLRSRHVELLAERDLADAAGRYFAWGLSFHNRQAG